MIHPFQISTCIDSVIFSCLFQYLLFFYFHFLSIGIYSSQELYLIEFLVFGFFLFIYSFVSTFFGLVALCLWTGHVYTVYTMLYCKQVLTPSSLQPTSAPTAEHSKGRTPCHYSSSDILYDDTMHGVIIIGCF